ncbi:MAG: helix-turn-helix domain-containing protein [Blautia sp.]|nr:helix-turn-helix domain-containing protein [Blautia sp.]
MGFLCSIACGLEKTSVDEIHLSYQEALHALRSHTIQIESSVFQYTGEEIGDQSGFLEIREEEQNLIHSILTYDPAGISACLDQIFDKAIVEKESFEKVSASCVRLASAVFSALDEMGLSFSGEFDTYQDTLLAIQGYHSVKHLRQFMGRFMEQVHVLLDQAEKRKYSSVVDQAVAYVKKHYQSELSVKSISAELYITPNYFSQIFKSQMGKNFTDYLNEVRVSHAKKLLRDKNRKVYEVAGECGYPNYKYFNSVFKKYTGYSPKEYRNGGV